MRISSFIFLVLFGSSTAYAGRPDCQFDLRGVKFKDKYINTMDDGDGPGIGCSDVIIILDEVPGKMSIAIENSDPMGEGCFVGKLREQIDGKTLSLSAPEADTGTCHYRINFESGRNARIVVDAAGT